MDKEIIKFSEDAARDLKDTFSRSATVLESQAASRSAAAEMILTDFRGPYADTYRQNFEQAAGDIAAIVDALRQVAYMADRAIEAHQEARTEQHNWFQRLIEDLAEGIGLVEKETVPAPPSPSLPAALPVSTTLKNAPVSAYADMVSGNPQKIRDGVSTLRGLDADLANQSDILTGAISRYNQDCAWAPIDVGNVISELSNWLCDNNNELIWLDGLATALENIPGDPTGVVSAPYSALSAALGNSGLPTRQPIAINNPTIHGTEASAGYIGDPVNAATGNFIEPETDLTYTPTSATLTFRRLYNATNPASGVFGTGWSSPLDSHLTLTDEKATWVKEDGQHIIFPRTGESWGRAQLHPFWLERLTPATGALDRLEVPLDDRWDEFLVITDNTGAIWVFSPTGSYLAHQVSEGDGISLVYNQNQQVSRIEHLRGRLIEIDYTTSGKVASLRGYDGTRIEYIYDETGDYLTQVISAAGSRTYTYNQAGLMDTVTAADGSLEVENTYDKQGRVCQQTYPHGVVRTYSYLANGVTLVRNADGSHANSWVSDEHGRLIGMIDAEQNRQSMAYDTFNNRVSVTERDGATTVRLFNNRGLITREVTPEGADTQWAYDEFDRVVSVVTAAGGLVAYEYADASGASRNPSRITDPLGASTELTWEQGLLTGMVGPTGVSVSFAYDSFGELTRVTNALGDSTVFERDAAGRVTAVVSPLGHRVSFTYDAAGNLISQQGPDGAKTSFAYGPGGRLLEMIDPAGSSTCYEYGAGGDLVAVVDPLGRRVSRSFDQMGNIASVTSASGASWNFDYDQLLNLVGARDPLGNRWVQEFDVTGQVTGLLDPTGVRQSIERNRASGVQKVVDAFGSLSLSLDAYGRLIKQRGPDGAEEVFTYDAAGQVVEVLDAQGGLTLIERDARGEITSVTSPLGRVTSFAYDAAGRLESMSEPSGVVTRLGYDADSRVISRVSSAGGFEYVTYDAASRVIQVRSDRGLERFSYDRCGRVKSVVDGRYGRRRFVYDAAGQLIRAVNGLGGVTCFEYSADGQLIRRVDPSGAVTLFAYDAAGRLVEKTDALGRVTGFSYDGAGRLTGEVSAGGDEFSYAYDAAGLLEKSWVNGQLQARLVRNVAARSVMIHDYTGFGGALVAEGPVVHGLVFDGVGRVVAYERTANTGTGGTAKTGTASCGVNTSLAYSYSPDGDLTQLVVDGVATDYAYDAGSGLLSSVVRYATGGQVLEGLTYHYDPVTSALVEIRDVAGSLVRSFGVAVTLEPVEQVAGEQSAHRQEEATDTDSNQTTTDAYRLDGGWVQISTYAHPRTGDLTEFRTYYNELGLVVGLEDEVDGLRLFSYDEAHQLIGVRSQDGFHSLTYSPEGFLTGEVLADGTERSYSYDVAGQLVRLEDSSAGVFEFVYDALGRRVRVSSSAGGVREFVFGPSGGVPGLVVERNSAAGEPGVGGSCAVWVDVLGQVAGVCAGGCCAPVVSGPAGSASPVPGSCASATFLSWDLTASSPRVLGASGVPVSLGLEASFEATGVRGVDPFGLSPVVAGFGAGLSGLPASSLAAGSSSASGLPGSSALPGSLFGLTSAGSLALGGLEVLGARVYDAGSRGFLSVDPVAAPVGAGWASNGYGFVGFSPVGLVDPWGLSPMSAAEFYAYRDDNRGRAWERAGKGLADFVDRNAGWIALGVGAIGLAALAVSGPIGWGILGGMALSGGIELASQLLTTGQVDWKGVAKNAAVGGIAGGLGAGATAVVSKVLPKVFNSGVNAVFGRAAQLGSRADEAASLGTRVGSQLADRYRQAQSVVTDRALGLSALPGKVGQFGQRIGVNGWSQAVGAYVEGGVDSMLMYVVDGHHVSAEGLVQAWGVPALSNAWVPGNASKGLDNLAQKMGWDAVDGLSARVRSRVTGDAGNFANGFVTYSGAPATYSEKYESYQEEGYEGAGWNPRKAFEEGFKEMSKSAASSSRPVESLRSVSFEAAPGVGVDVSGVVRDTALGVVGGSGGLTSVGKVSVDEVKWEQARREAQEEWDREHE